MSLQIRIYVDTNLLHQLVNVFFFNVVSRLFCCRYIFVLSRSIRC